MLCTVFLHLSPAPDTVWYGVATGLKSELLANPWMVQELATCFFRMPLICFWPSAEAAVLLNSAMALSAVEEVMLVGDKRSRSEVETVSASVLSATEDTANLLGRLVLTFGVIGTSSGASTSSFSFLSLSSL